MKKPVSILILLLALGILMPKASRWLEEKRAKSLSDEMERFNDTVKTGIPLSGTAEIYLDKASIYTNQGTVYFERGDLAAASAYYNQAIKLDPKYVTAYINRGKVYSKQGRLDQAISDFNLALEIEPDNAEAYRLLGFTYLEKEDLDQAISYCNKAIAAKTSESDTEEYRSKDPEPADSFWIRGTAYRYKGDLNQALSDYNQAIKIGSFFHLESYYLARAKLYHQMREYAKSWEDVRKIESSGGKVEPEFLGALKKDSGLPK